MGRTTKRILSITLAFAVTLASVCGGVRIHGVTPDTKAAKAAEAAGLYISNVAVSYASSREAAEKELGEEYTVLENKVGECFVGYTTTDDPDLAIRDIKVQSMTGKYSVSDYEELLKNHKDAIDDQVDIFVPALIEFTKNYDSDMDAALIICKHLNCFYEDDSDMAFGDYLLEQGRRLTGDAKDATARKELEKIFVEGNDDLIRQMENLITQGIDTKVTIKGTWVTRMSELGPRGLIDLYKQSFKNLRSDSAVKKQLEKDFGEDAAMLLKELPKLQTYLRERTDSDVAKAIEDGDEKKVEALSDEIGDTENIWDQKDDPTIPEIAESMGESMDRLTDAVEYNENAAMGALKLFLKGISYGDQTMYDFLMNENIEKSDLYTFAYVLSAGQKSIIRDVGLYSVFQSAMSGYAEEDEENADLDDVISEKSFSIYDGVDRDVFKGDTALTEDALKRMQTDNDNSFLTMPPAVSGLLAIAALAVGTYCFVKLTSIVLNGGVVTKVKYVHQTVTYIQGENSLAFKTANKAANLIVDECNIMMENQYALQAKYIEQKGLVKDFKLDVNFKKVEPDFFETKVKSLYQELKAKGNYEKVVNMSEATKKQFLDERWAEFKKLNDERIKILNSKTVLEQTQKQTSYTRIGIGARVLYVIGALAAFAFAGYEIYQMVKKDPKVEFTEIPANMVNRTYDEDEINYMTYSVAKTKDGKKADLRNWKGNQWVALYTTSDENAGEPILASSFAASESNTTSDANMAPVSEFCYKDAYNISEKKAAYLFFKTGMQAPDAADEDPDQPGAANDGVAGTPETEAAVFGWSGMLWIILVLVVIVGVGVGTAIYIRKRKR